MGIISDSIKANERILTAYADSSETKKNRIYISGPMRGKPKFNAPAFNSMAKLMRAGGHYVFNPAESFDGDFTKDFSEYMREDYQALLDTDMIVMLPGWQDSEGARLEFQVATSLGHKVIYAPGAYTGLPVELDAAKIVRNGEREAVYGHPGADFARTGQYWGVEPQEVALRMIQLKISRLIASPDHEDSIKDLIGYAICYARIMLEKEGYGAH